MGSCDLMHIMKIGILSDTHGNISATAKAAQIFRNAGVSAIFHCGDIGGMDVLAELAGVFEPLGVPVHAVLGNVDIYAADWKFFPTNVGVQLHGRFGDITLDGIRIALLHSDDARRYRKTVSSRDYELVLSGHTHVPHDYISGKTRCINPGTAGRGMPNTCAVLDVSTAKLDLIEL